MNNPVRKIIAAISALALFTVAACSTDESTNATEELKIVSTFTLLTDMIKEIGGEHVDVHNLVPTGTDPHEYDPLPQDLEEVTEADLLFYNGLGLEGDEQGWLQKLTDSVGFDKTKTVEAAAGVEPKYLKDEDGQKEINPHAFIDPTVGITMAENVTEALADALPDQADAINESGNKYVEKIEGIEKDYGEQLGAIPDDERILVTSEHAFQYLADTYDMKELYIWEIDTDENGSPDQISQLVEQLKTEKPKHLFVESNVDDRPMKTVSKESGIPIFPEPIHSDELGEPGSTGDTYENFLTSNLETMVAGLS